MIREGFLEEVGLSLEKVGWEEGKEAGCFVAWASLEPRVGGGDRWDKGWGSNAGKVASVTRVAPRVSPHIISHQGSAARDKRHSLHFIGNSCGSGQRHSYSQ